MAGGKVVKLDRVIFENIADEQTAIAALQAGEIDFYELPPHDLLDQLEKDTNIDHPGAQQARPHRLDAAQLPASALQQSGCAPGDAPPRQAGRRDARDVRAIRNHGRPAAPTSPAARRWRTTSTPTGSRAARTSPRRRSCSPKAGYDGQPVVVLQATNHYLDNPAGLFAAQWLRQAGINVDLAAIDWGALVTRRAVKKPPAEGGWNIFFTTVAGSTLRQPDRLRRPRGQRRQGLVRLADERDARGAARQMGDRADARGAQGDRARAAGERLGLRAAPLSSASGSPAARTSRPGRMPEIGRRGT